MNAELIKRLTDQAKQSVPAGLDVTTWVDVYNAKFAELIVRECIEVVVDVLPDIVIESKDGIHPAWHLKEHFGVEE